MISNMLNDLAEAMKALDGKKWVTGMRVGQLTGLTDSGLRIGPGLVKNPSKNMQAVVSDPRTEKFSHWF